jgi:hypothetical protein
MLMAPFFSHQLNFHFTFIGPDAQKTSFTVGWPDLDLVP